MPSDSCSGTQHIKLGFSSWAKPCHNQVNKDDKQKRLIQSQKLGQTQNEEDVKNEDDHKKRRPHKFKATSNMKNP